MVLDLLLLVEGMERRSSEDRKAEKAKKAETAEAEKVKAEPPGATA